MFFAIRPEFDHLLVNFSELTRIIEFYTFRHSPGFAVPMNG
jgi:hypothetical protein